MRIGICGFVLLFAALSLVQCKKEDSEELLPENEEQKTQVVFDESESLVPLFTSEGGTDTVSFTSSVPWRLTFADSTYADWLRFSPQNGDSGKGSFIIESSPNESFEDRSVTLWLLAGDTTIVMDIIQKSKGALIVTPSEIEVSSMGAQIDVVVKTNEEFKVSTSASWILYIRSRALSTDTLHFSISRYSEEQPREGCIVIESETQKDTITVKQEGRLRVKVREGDVELRRNWQLGEFAKQGYTHIRGNLLIESNEKYGSDAIRSLSSLNTLRNISGTLTISSVYGLLKSFNGLDNLESVEGLSIDGDFDGDTLSFKEFGKLKKLSALVVRIDNALPSSDEGFSSLEEIEYSLIVGGELVDFKRLGLTSLKRVGWLHADDYNLISFEGLESLERIEKLFIGKNIESFKGLESVKSIDNVNWGSGINGKIRSFVGLNEIDSLGNVAIRRDDPIESFEGLESLRHLGNVTIESDYFKSLKGLESVQTIGGMNIYGINDDNINSFEDLRSIESINLICFYNRKAPLSFKGLEKIKEMQDIIVTYSNTGNPMDYPEVSLAGLNSLERIEGLYVTGVISFEELKSLKYIGVFSCASNCVRSFKGLENLEEIGTVFTSPASITSYEGLENLKKIGGTFESNHANQAKDFKGLEALTFVGGDFICPSSIESFHGLSSLKSIGGKLSVGPNLRTLEGLSSLQTIGGILQISAGYLENLKGLESLESLGGLDLKGKDITWGIPCKFSSFQGLSSSLKINGGIEIGECPALFDFTPLGNILQDFSGAFRVYRCGYNPTLKDIQEGRYSADTSKQ